jgi:RND family efflux transporter MFP subunit
MKIRQIQALLARCLRVGLATALGFTLVGCHKPDAAGRSTKYHCPMHPTYVSDRPGDCPICNMKLVPVKGAGEAASAAKATPKASGNFNYQCPQHPDYTFDQPGTCDFCGTQLVRLPAEGTDAGVPGRTIVAISPEKRHLIGLRTTPVLRTNLTQTLRTTATIEHDETRLTRIAPRFGGWAQKLFVNFTGQEVEKGQPLLTVYSPELFAAESEYLLAWQRLTQTRTNASGLETESARRMYESARRRLRLWEIGEDEIRALEQSGQPHEELLWRAPVAGHVMAKTAIEGKAFMAGETLYEIGDLSHLWLRAYVYEADLPLVRTGQTARVILPYLGHKVYESRVKFLYPHIEPQTRRAQMRLELENPRHELRPEMWANVEIAARLDATLAVPASAVIHTGTRFVAFVLRADDHLEPRELKLGFQTDDWAQVLGGVKQGEQVVTRALFLVDAESQLKAAIAEMAAGSEHQH